jgi:hypothetical protein
MASKSSKEFLQAALTNGTFDSEALEKALRMTVDNSYSYLYRLQRSTIVYEEFFYTTRNVTSQPDFGDLYLDKQERVCANIPAELVTVSSRERYRTSDYYKEEIGISDITGNHRIFSKLPVIIMDDHIFLDCKIMIYDDYFRIIFPFKRDFLYEKNFDDTGNNYTYIEHKFSVQIINNTMYADLITNSGMLMRNSEDGASYGRILGTYLTASKVDLSNNYTGSMFAVVYFGDSKYGSMPQDVSIGENGDVYVEYDKETREALMNYTGSLTIRFLFYRYLYPKYGYRKEEGDYESGYIQSRTSPSDEVMSDLFMITDKDEKLYGMPVPTENMILYRNRGDGFTHIENSHIQVNYPNIYRINQDVEENDTYRVYYFYIPPYDLSYKYMYEFYYSYLKYKYPDYSLEKIFNMLYFEDYDLENDSMLSEVPEAEVIIPEEFEDPEESRLGLFYEWASEPENRGKTKEQLKAEFDETHQYDKTVNEMTEEEKAAYLEEQRPIRLADFKKVFDFIVNHPIVNYFYDEIDYTKNYMGKVPPLEYKTRKLEEFIGDNFNALHDYELAKRQVTNKYDFSAEEADLPNRYTEVSVSTGKTLIEPCYVFSISKPDPDNTLTARIFVDGLFISNFIYERSEYCDNLYVPVDQVPDDVTYFEIEVFPTLNQYEVVTFTAENPSVVITFDSTDEIQATLSDLYFFFGTEECLDRISVDNFRLEVVSDDYNAYEVPVELITVYKLSSGAYYNEDGQYFNYEGQNLSEKDITKEELQEKIAAGTVTEGEVKKTTNLFEINRDEDYITFNRVVTQGESIINRDNTGVNFTILNKLKITAISADVMDKELTIAIAKNPYFFTKTAQATCYPIFNVHSENLEPIAEYTRVFYDGRLRSRNRYDFRKFNGILQVRALETLERRSTMSVDITPYRNRLIYYVEQLDSDYVDLRGIIDKPYDNRYYEIYLNGRRLNCFNIFPISPWEIKLAGIHSYYNLEIYQRDTDWEYFDISFDDYYTISDLARESFVERKYKNLIIHDVTGDTAANENTEEKEPWSREDDTYTIMMSMFMYERVTELGLLDPSILQFNQEDILTNYEIIDTLYKVQNDKGEDVYLLNPDNYYKPENPDGEERWRVFLLGNRDPEEFKEGGDDNG